MGSPSDASPTEPPKSVNGACLSDEAPRRQMRYPGDLTTEEWAVLEPLVCRPSCRRRPSVWPTRRMLDAVFTFCVRVALVSLTPRLSSVADGRLPKNLQKLVVKQRLRTLLADATEPRVSSRRPQVIPRGKRRTSASRITVVVHRTEELLTASTRQQVLSRADARGRFGAPKPVFEVSPISELSGSHAPDGRAPVAGVEHCGTRWHYDLAEEPVPEGSGRRPPGTRTRVRTRPPGAGDTGRPVRFCSDPERLLLSGPTAPVGRPPSKLARR